MRQRHALRALEQAVDKHLAFRIETVRSGLLQKEADVVDVLQWTTQIVSDGVGEGLDSLLAAESSAVRSSTRCSSSEREARGRGPGPGSGRAFR